MCFCLTICLLFTLGKASATRRPPTSGWTLGWPPVGIDVFGVASSRTREPPHTGSEFTSCGAVSTGDSVPASDSEDFGPLNMNLTLVYASAEVAADIIRTHIIIVFWPLARMRNGNETGSSEVGSSLLFLGSAISSSCPHPRARPECTLYSSYVACTMGATLHAASRLSNAMEAARHASGVRALERAGALGRGLQGSGWSTHKYKQQTHKRKHKTNKHKMRRIP